MKKSNVFFAWCVIVLVLAGCGSPGSVIDLSGVKTNSQRFVWGSNSDITASLGESALFYMKDCLICYYDLEEEEEYILCGKANCRHTSTECSAYFPCNLIGQSADNVAQIDEYIYCTYLSATLDASESSEFANAVQVLRIDPATGARKAIASFPYFHDAADEAQAFCATSIGAVQYCNGYAWFDLNLQQRGALEQQGLSFTQLCGVNLETEELICLNQYDNCYYSFDAICADTVFYTRFRDTVPLLSENEFYEMATEEGTVTIDGVAYESYMDYYSWHWRNTPDEYGIYAYHVETGETQLILGGTSEFIQGSYQIPYEIYGAFDGKVLCSALVPDETESDEYHTEVYLLNPANGEREKLVEWKQGGCLSIAQGYKPNLVFSDGTFFYADNMNGETADLYAYDLNAGTSTYLFTDDAAITFRIFGEYQDGYFGKHKDHQYQEGYYWISKEDFYAGNLDTMVHYDAG